MEVVFEFIGETLFELIVEGALELSTGKKRVPLVFRILAALFLFVLFFGFSGWLIFYGIKDGEIALVILGGFLFLLFGALIIRKLWEKRKEG